VGPNLNAARIRNATLQDAEALTDLLLVLGFPDFAKLTRNEVSHQLQEKLDVAQAPSHTLLVAESGTNIIGYAAVHWLPCLFRPKFDGYLSELFVAPAARGRSVGTRLLQAVHDKARRQGCTRLTLVNRRDRESYARGFYARHGWVEQPEAARFSYTLK